MQLDSKSIPLLAGLLVLLLAGVFVVGRSMKGPAGGTQPAVVSPDAAAVPEPENLHPQLVAGRASIRAGNIDEALAQLAQVPDSDASYLLALNDRGIVLEKLGRADEALATFHTILEVQPEDPFALYGVCRAHVLMGGYAEAELACLRCLEIDPRNARARFEVGLIRVAQDRLPLAVDAYLRAVNQHKDENVIRQAALDLDVFSQNHPELAGPHYAMAVLAQVLGSRETEREELELYLAMAPTGPAADNARTSLDRLTKLGF